MARSFFYDTAQSSNPVAMGALRQVIPVSQIVFGTDFPFRTAAEHVKGLAASQTFSSEELRAIYRHNAVRLLPQFARVSDIASIASGRRRRSVPCRSYPEPEQEQRRQQENDRASKGNPATIEYAKDFAERIANSRVETIPGAGHVPLVGRARPGQGAGHELPQRLRAFQAYRRLAVWLAFMSGGHGGRLLPYDMVATASGSLPRSHTELARRAPEHGCWRWAVRV